MGCGATVVVVDGATVVIGLGCGTMNCGDCVEIPDELLMLRDLTLDAQAQQMEIGDCIGKPQ
jgi:aerobic-type carbon monoxide dehydrogenase small subunit (CoxS/CutS family)